MIGRPWADPRRQLSDYLLSPEPRAGEVRYSAYGVDAAIAATPNYKLQRDRIARRTDGLSGFELRLDRVRSSAATVNLVADVTDYSGLPRHLPAVGRLRRVSSNIEDRRSIQKPVAGLSLTAQRVARCVPDRMAPVIMSDRRQSKAYKESGSNLGTSLSPTGKTRRPARPTTSSSPVGTTSAVTQCGDTPAHGSR